MERAGVNWRLGPHELKEQRRPVPMTGDRRELRAGQRENCKVRALRGQTTHSPIKNCNERETETIAQK
jgi:hypothetical protein